MRFHPERAIRPARDPSTAAAVEPTDRELVATFQGAVDRRTRRQAASLLLGRYRRRVLIWCRRVLGEPDAAEDAAQEVLISALRGLPGYEDHGDFGAWLFMIARNRCLSELRRRRVPLADEAVLELIADGRPGPDQEFLARRLGGDLERLLRDTLDPLEQDAIRLRCDEGLPVDVITSRLAIAEATGARAVLQRARRKLRRALAAREEDQP